MEIWISLVALIISATALYRTEQSAKRGLSLQQRQTLTDEVIAALAVKNIGTPTFRLEGFADAIIGMDGDPSLRVLICNPGGYLLKINYAEIRVHSYQYPDADITEKLTSIQIAAGGHHPVPIRIKHANIQRMGTEKFSAEIRCHASYKDANNEDADSYARYQFDALARRWEQAVNV